MAPGRPLTRLLGNSLAGALAQVPMAARCAVKGWALALPVRELWSEPWSGRGEGAGAQGASGRSTCRNWCQSIDRSLPVLIFQSRAQLCIASILLPLRSSAGRLGRVAGLRSSAHPGGRPAAGQGPSSADAARSNKPASRLPGWPAAKRIATPTLGPPRRPQKHATKTGSHTHAHSDSYAFASAGPSSVTTVSSLRRRATCRSRHNVAPPLPLVGEWPKPAFRVPGEV